MSDRVTIQVQPRTLHGNKVKRLRKEGYLPANIYGSQIDSVAIQVSTIDLQKLIKSVGESEVINVEVEGEDDPRPVLIGDAQKDPVSHDLLHVDFRQIDLSQKVTVEAEVRFEGIAPPTEAADVVLLELTNVLEVTALPMELPSEIVVDVSQLTEINDAVTVGDLDLPDSVEIHAEDDQLICKVDVIQIKEEEEEPEDEELLEELELEGEELSDEEEAAASEESSEEPPEKAEE